MHGVETQLDRIKGSRPSDGRLECDSSVNVVMYAVVALPGRYSKKNEHEYVDVDVTGLR